MDKKRLEELRLKKYVFGLNKHEERELFLMNQLQVFLDGCGCANYINGGGWIGMKPKHMICENLINWKK